MNDDNALIPEDSSESDNGNKPAKRSWLGGENQKMGSKQREERWLTPSKYVEALGKFDLDPCGAPGHVLAEKTFLLENGDDGLRDEWHGRVWMNPPYGNKTAPFMKKLADHGNGIALIFARTETRMWFSEIWPRADAVFFIKGRISFLDENAEKTGASAGAPSAFIAYGEENVEALRNSGIEGRLVLLDNTILENDTEDGYSEKELFANSENSLFDENE